MKNFLLFASVVLSANVFAQNTLQLKHVEASTTLTPNAIVTASTSPGANIKVTFDLKNISSTSQTYNAYRYDKTLNSGAAAYFCFAGTCYGDQTFVSPTALTLNPGQSASQLSGQYNMLVSDLDEGPAVGFSEVRYTFKNVSNPADSAQVIVQYNQVMGLKNNAGNVSALSVYPNPASHNVFIKLSSNNDDNALISVVNLLGSVVMEEKRNLSAGDNTLNFNVESLPAGVYFANVKTGNTLSTKKFIVK